MHRRARLPLLLAAFTTVVLPGCESSPSAPPPGVTVTGVSVSAPATAVAVGATLQLTATVTPSTASQAVAWSSSDATIATVSGGLVTALKPGSVGITATSTADPTRSASVDLAVTGCATLQQANVANGGTLQPQTCHIVQSALSVSGGLLTVGPGVRIEFGTAGSLMIASGGSMKAMGTAALPITFTSIDPVGTWRGIRFNNSRTADNVLHYVTIENGGSTGWTGAAHSRAALLLDGNSLVDIQHSTIAGSSAQGINVYGDAEMKFENNTLRDNAVAAWVHPNTVRFISGNNIFENNTENNVRVAFGSGDAITNAQTWHALDDRKSVVERLTQGPRLEFQDRVFVEAAWTIDSSAVLTFRPDVRLIVEPTGSLSAVGTATSPIVFAAVVSHWTGLQIRSASANNRFDHVVFVGGGSQPWTGNPDSRAMVYLDGNSRALITNTSFQQSDHYALWVPAGGDISGFDGNDFLGNVRSMIIHANRVGGMTANNFFSDNTENKVRVGIGSTDVVTVAQTWNAFYSPPGPTQTASTVPYYVTARIFVEAPLTIETSFHNSSAGMVFPGVVEFAQDASLVVREGGSLRSAGVAGRPVIFRGGEDVNGYWQGIEYNTVSTGNELVHTIVSNAGSGPWFGGNNSRAAVHVTRDGYLSLTNVTFQKSGSYAMIISLGGAATCTGVDHGGFLIFVYTGPGAGSAGSVCQ